MMKKDTYSLLIDITIIAVSIMIAVIMAKTKVLETILTSTQGVGFIGSFVAGMFFTSVFTTAPATVTLGEIAQVSSIWATTLLGAMGATLVDLTIFRFVRERFCDHLLKILKQEKSTARLKYLLNLKFFRWFSFMLGGLIIASPLPDELGIALLGFSKMKPSRFIPFTFIANFTGILVIGLIARALL